MLSSSQISIAFLTSALCKGTFSYNPDKIFDIVKAVVEAVDVPVTVKIRSGWDEASINAKEIAKVIESAGASAITVHPRTRKQGYSGNADWNIIKEVKEKALLESIKEKNKQKATRDDR